MHDLGLLIVQNSKAKIKIITGDGRIALQEKIKKHDLFNLIHMDAFTGDGIPTHLLTKEAIQTYLNRLAENGIILFHISNRYYDLAPIIEKTAERLDLNSVQSPEINNTTFEWTNPSICVAVSRKKETLLPLIESGWLNIDNKIINESKITPWTDVLYKRSFSINTKIWWFKKTFVIQKTLANYLL